MKQFSWFLFAGSIGFIADFITFSVLALYISVHIARCVAFLVAVNITFLLNRKLTFKDQKASYTLYLLGQCKGILINILLFELILMIFDSPSHFVKLAAFTSGSVSALIFNYIFAKKIVFKASKELISPQKISKQQHKL